MHEKIILQTFSNHVMYLLNDEDILFLLTLICYGVLLLILYKK